MKKSAYSVVFMLLVGVSLASAVKAQTITTVAGGGPNGLPATASNLNVPQAITFDSFGNAFIVTPNQVYKVDTTRLLTIYAGRGLQMGVSAGDNGPATQADFVFAESAAADSKGNLFIADDLTGEIRRVDATTHKISTYVTVAQPHQIAFDKQNNLFIADSSGYVWRVDAKTRAVSAFVATIVGPMGIAFDSSGNLFISDQVSTNVYRVDSRPSHAITTIFSGLHQVPGLGVATDKNGNVFVADAAGFVFRWDAGSQTVAQIATDAGLSFPLSVAVRGNTLYVADSHNFRIPAIDITSLDPSQEPVSLFAGNCDLSAPDVDCSLGFAGDGYDASQASLLGPDGVIKDSYGNLYISDSNNNVVRRVSALTNTITTYAGNTFRNSLDPTAVGDGGVATFATLYDPVGLAFDGFRNLYIADALHDRVRIVDPLLHRINTVIGTGLPSATCDDTGPASAASVLFPYGVASDLFGNLFVTDQGGDPCIRKIDAFTRNVSKYASGPPLSFPVAVARDSRGNLYVSDFAVIMRIDGQNQTITVLVGDQTDTCSFPPLQDGVPAISLSLCTAPSGIAVDGDGNLYFSDPDNFVVREVDASTGLVYTVAGNGTAGFSGDGGPATSAQLASPGGLFVDRSGNLYIADTGNNRVRKVVLSRH